MGKATQDSVVKTAIAKALQEVADITPEAREERRLLHDDNKRDLLQVGEAPRAVIEKKKKTFHQIDRGKTCMITTSLN